MIPANTMKERYRFTADDEKALKSLMPLMEHEKDSFYDSFFENIMSDTKTAEFFGDPKRQDRHKMAIDGWYLKLFSGPYDESYFRYVRHVGKVHVDIGLDGHFVNSAMATARNYIVNIILSHVPEPERDRALVAVGKILDLNLDVLTSSYRRAELQKYFLSVRVENTLINWMERFTHGLNLVLALALGVVSIAVVGLFIHDVIGIFKGPKIETGVVAALGSLLIIWMMIELLGTEISHLKGKKIPIKLFVGVVIVAFIRKVLIATLQHQDLTEYISRVATLLILGIVYWLVTRADK